MRLNALQNEHNEKLTIVTISFFWEKKFWKERMYMRVWTNKQTEQQTKESIKKEKTKQYILTLTNWEILQERIEGNDSWTLLLRK